ncbi:MAG: TMAO reductase system periplasmic protein TorT [Gallionella sp.]|nr:TMAO reductase system periplasmic protein TorT [Gallionella sp.]
MHRINLRQCFSKAILVMAVLCAFSMPPALAESIHPAAKFAPIPILSIFPPLKHNGSADDALATGQVVAGAYTMAAPASKPWRIAFLFPHVKDPYWVDCTYGLISEAKRLGVAIDIFPADGYNDLIGQLRMMDEAIAAKYDAIVISPISQTGNNASIAKARALGIPVFELANDSTSDDLTIKITSSLRAMGTDTTDWVIRDAQKRGKKSINIALLPGPKDAGWVMGEVEGTRIAARNAPIKVNIVDIRYGDSDLIGQSQLAEQVLVKHGKHLDYILGCTDCAPAAIMPLHAAGLHKRIKIVAYGLTREMIHHIRAGEVVAATDVKAVNQARVTIDAAVDYLEGRIKERPHTILIKLGMVDRANVDSYDYDISTAPQDYRTTLSYRPKGKY